jgi:hypothetical protein
VGEACVKDMIDELAWRARELSKLLSETAAKAKSP